MAGRAKRRKARGSHGRCCCGGPHDAERKTTANEVGGIAAGQLRAFAERIEPLEGEKKALAGDIKDVYAEAKRDGVFCAPRAVA